MSSHVKHAPKIVATRPNLHANCVEWLVFFAICRDHPFTMRESPYFRALPWHLPPLLAISVVMAVIGPFGTYNVMGLGDRRLCAARARGQGAGLGSCPIASQYPRSVIQIGGPG